VTLDESTKVRNYYIVKRGIHIEKYALQLNNNKWHCIVYILQSKLVSKFNNGHIERYINN